MPFLVRKFSNLHDFGEEFGGLLRQEMKRIGMDNYEEKNSSVAGAFSVLKSNRKSIHIIPDLYPVTLKQTSKGELPFFILIQEPFEIPLK